VTLLGQLREFDVQVTLSRVLQEAVPAFRILSQTSFQSGKT